MLIWQRGILYRKDTNISDFIQNIINDYVKEILNRDTIDTEQERIFKQYYLRYILSDKDYDTFIGQLE